FPKYDAGEFKESDSTMLLSRGIGSHTIPLRIANRAEIICVTLKKKKEHR
ncbi:MAG: metallophosphoesterase, partial [Clostridia bacterium]|nr:metallophosphoesterase [Clostridia bacterium]